MPRKKLTMRKIREVLRLKAAGLNIREVAARTGAARTTVYEYLVRAEGAGLTWPLPDDLDDEALEARLFPPATAELAQRRPLPDSREVHRELRRSKHATLRLLWLEWKEDHPDGWGYSQFCAHYESWLGCQDVVMRLSYPAGERMFVDFSGDKIPVTDPTTGEVSEAEVFVAVLGASGMLYVEATADQGLESWAMAHVRAFEAYGGVTVAVTPDNLKSGVTKACYYDPEVNASYAELARHYGTAILPTRTYRPRDKASATDCTSMLVGWGNVVPRSFTGASGAVPILPRADGLHTHRYDRSRCSTSGGSRSCCVPGPACHISSTQPWRVARAGSKGAGSCRCRQSRAAGPVPGAF